MPKSSGRTVLRPVRRPLPRVGGRRTGGFPIDLHVHTGRYSPCAEALLPELLAPTARARRLAGVVLADHDVLWAEEEVRALQRRDEGVRLFRGMECSARGAHLVMVGLEEPAPFYRGMPPLEAVELAHRQGACVILPHPFRDGDPPEELWAAVDAVEVASLSFTAVAARRSWALARRWGRPAVAGSDAHAPRQVGWAWTTFPRMPRDERELAELIRSGRGRPGREGRFPG